MYLSFGIKLLCVDSLSLLSRHFIINKYIIYIMTIIINTKKHLISDQRRGAKTGLDHFLVTLLNFTLKIVFQKIYRS